MKKGNTLILLSAVFTVLVMSFVSATFYFPDVRSITQGVIDNYVNIGEPILSALFGGYGGWTGFLLFERFLLFILLVSVIYVILGRFELFEDYKMIRWLVAVIMPLIGMRFINYEQISAVFGQYQVLAIALSSLLPFIVFFYFVHSVGKSYPHLRKILWVLFIAIYLGLWNTAQSDFQGSLYFWTMAAAVLLLIFDRRIEMYLAKREIAKRERWRVDDEIAKINRRIDDINEEIRMGRRTNPKEARKEIKELEQQKKDWERHRWTI